MNYFLPQLKFYFKKLTGQMSFTNQDLNDYPILMAKKDDVWVTIGPCSAAYWSKFKIPLDGRQYKCGGTIIFKNGDKHRASFIIDTTTFDFINIESIYLNIGDKWFGINEPELLKRLELSKEEIFPFTWLTDRPLDYHKQGPYNMKL
jgi:hypothetical protein